MQIDYNDNLFPIKRVEFSTSGDIEIKNRSVFKQSEKGIIISDLYDNGEPKKDSLIDTNMGVTSKEYNCSKCGFSEKYCEGHTGHIKLAVPMYNLIYFELVVKILRCVCLECSRLKEHNENIVNSMKDIKNEYKLLKYKDLVKNKKNCSYCNSPLPKIKPEKKSFKIKLDYNNSSDSTLKTMSEEELTSERSYKILSNIRTADITFLGIDGVKNPAKNFMFNIIPVPPVQIRPSVRGDLLSSKNSEDSLTITLNCIVKLNKKIYDMKDKMTENNKKNFGFTLELLQTYICGYIDNETTKSAKIEQCKIPTGSLTKRLKGKKGRIRDNLMGKRTNFSARTVITPDPMLKINEVGVPVAIAKKMTFPEIVNPSNIEKLRQYIKNGPSVYPGANYVIKENTINCCMPQLCDIRTTINIDIKYGDIVERHLIDGDILLFNRQPSLHKQSIMGHYAKVIDNPEYNTFRMNPNVCTPYNADFDKQLCRKHGALKACYSIVI